MKMLLELKGFILLKVFSSDVQSVFPFDISYAYLLMKITKCFPLIILFLFTVFYMNPLFIQGPAI
jgi:hypothetical protein